MTQEEKEHWEYLVDTCKWAIPEIKHKWLTESGVHSTLMHLPEYESVCTSDSEEEIFVAATIRKLHQYAKEMFGFSPCEVEEADTSNWSPYYFQATGMHNQSFIGAVCGDIIGSVYEFNRTKDYNFELFTSRSRFTDDTVMTCAVADWLRKDSEHTHNGLIRAMREYSRKYPNMSYGNMFSIWLKSIHIAPYNSFGNGSAMRVSPVGFYAESLEEALELARISAEVTHNHPQGIIGAQAVAAAIYIMKAASIEDDIENGKEKVRKFLKEQYSYKVEYTEQEWEEHVKKYTFNETCQGSVPEAIYCALSSDSYEQAIRKAVSLGGDADTQAAIAGGIAAAFYPVPLDIISRCLERLTEDLIDVIDHFNSSIVYKEMLKNKEYPYSSKFKSLQMDSNDV